MWDGGGVLRDGPAAAALLFTSAGHCPRHWSCHQLCMTRDEAGTILYCRAPPLQLKIVDSAKRNT